MMHRQYRLCQHNAASHGQEWRHCNLVGQTVTPGVCDICARRGRDLVQHGPDLKIYPPMVKSSPADSHVAANNDPRVFENAAGLACQVDGWPEFAEAATPEYRREAMLILAQSNWTPCERAARLRRLVDRWNIYRLQKENHENP